MVAIVLMWLLKLLQLLGVTVAFPVPNRFLVVCTWLSRIEHFAQMFRVHEIEAVKRYPMELVA
jgi:hypothetical protein